jgi:hypothetical protein
LLAKQIDEALVNGASTLHRRRLAQSVDIGVRFSAASEGKAEIF